jgi:hypothetical protein
MKTYLCPQAITAIIPALQLRRLMGILLATLLCLAAFADGGNTQLVWRNARLESGVAGQNGAIYRFPQVDSKIDALVKINQRSSALVSLVNIDLTNTGWDKAWQPQVSYNNGTAPGAADWWMEFEITFVNKGTSTPAIVNDFLLSAIDIDGNGDKIREYVTMYNLKSYILETGSLLNITNIFELLGGLLTLNGKRFDGPTINFNNIDTSGTSVMTTAEYKNRNSFRIRTGAVASAANGAADRMYSLYFKEFSYQAPVGFTLPLVLLDFKATMNNKNKVALNWTTGKEKELSHFVIERSVNGVDYTDAAMIMATGNSNVKIDYAFNDAINSQSKGVLYYRLRMVDADGKYQHSTVRMIRVGEQKENVTIAAYPNPVTTELRITVPATWQNKTISFDLYNANGQIVKHVVAGNAGQTETINVNDLAKGAYIVKATNGGETAVQRIIK